MMILNNEKPLVTRQALFVGMLVVFAFASCGCSRGPTMYTVAGSVTLDGAPVHEGYVIFSPRQGAANSAVSGLIANGGYTLQCPEGPKTVTITGRMENGSVLPVRYLEPTEELEVVVAPESLKFDFALQKKLNRRNRRR